MARVVGGCDADKANVLVGEGSGLEIFMARVETYYPFFVSLRRIPHGIGQGKVTAITDIEL